MIARTVSIDRIARVTVGLPLVATAAAAATGRADATSVAAGGAFAVVNFHLIRMLVSRLIAPGSDGRRTASLLGTKFLLLLALLAVALKRLPIEPASFGGGASLLLLAIVLDATLLGEPVGPLEENDGGDPTGDGADGVRPSGERDDQQHSG